MQHSDALKLARLRLLTALFLILTIAVPLRAQDPVPKIRSVRVERGQMLELVLLTSFDSANSRVGDQVSLKLLRPLVAQGTIVLPADTILHGTVTSVRAAGRNCKDGHVAWTFNSIAVNHKTIQLQEVGYYLARSAKPLPGLDGYRVSFPPTHRLRKVVRAVELAPFVALATPWLVTMIIAESTVNHCPGVSGKDVNIAAGHSYLRSRFPRYNGHTCRCSQLL